MFGKLFSRQKARSTADMAGSSAGEMDGVRVSREELTAQLDVWEKRLMELAKIVEVSRAAAEREPAASDAG